MTCFSNHVPCESDLVCPQRRTVYQDDLWPQSKEAGLAWESGGCPDSRLWLGLTALRPPHCLFQRLHREPGIARDHNPGVNLYQHFGNMMQFTRTVQHIHPPWLHPWHSEEEAEKWCRLHRRSLSQMLHLALQSGTDWTWLYKRTSSVAFKTLNQNKYNSNNSRKCLASGKVMVRWNVGKPFKKRRQNLKPSQLCCDKQITWEIRKCRLAGYHVINDV